jgi:hypothetical protein
MDAFLAMLELHGPIGAVLLAFVYIGRQHFRSDDERHRAGQKRLAHIESEQKKDLQQVYRKIDETSRQNIEILKILTQRKPD